MGNILLYLKIVPVIYVESSSVGRVSKHEMIWDKL